MKKIGPDLGKVFLISAACLTIGGFNSVKPTENLLSATARPPASEVRLRATSAGISPLKTTFIVLYWNKEPKASGYNIYRIQKNGLKPSPILLNSEPITSVKNCEELKKIISPGSPEWLTMFRAFSAAGGREKTGIPSKPVPEVTKKAASEETVSKFPILSSSRGVGWLRSLLAAIDLCPFFEKGLTAEQEAVFDVLASYNLKFRLARGLAFIDDKVTPEEEYVYELRAVDKQGKESLLATSQTVKAGHFILPPAPQNPSASASDSKVLLTWDRQQEDFSYIVLRAERRGGPYLVVNSQPVVFDVKTDLEGNILAKPQPGFVDYQWWTEEGLPTAHEVEGNLIDGPKNGKTYFYKIAALDILGRRGAESNIVEATPRDLTPPSAPTSFVINVSPSRPVLILTWKKSIRDVEGHREQDRRHVYRIYRSERMEDLELLGVRTPDKSRKRPLPKEVESKVRFTLERSRPVAEIPADPTDINHLDLSWIDDWPGLVQEYGEKDFFYRLICEDEQGNQSAPSAIVSGRIPDRKPPGPTRVVESEGLNDRIKIFWLPNPEPDLAGYQIYRSLCDRGSVYRPALRAKEVARQFIPCDFVLIGQVLLPEGGAEIDASGRIFFEDRTVPEGSPICYSYWVRAFDQARNVYPGDSNQCPKEGEFICQKLYERTPPPAPVITGLKAKNNAVLIEWTSSPIQDLRAFHIYRSLEENGEPEFVACVYIDGTLPSREPWKGVGRARCEDIPAEPNPVSLAVSYLDNTILPNKIYWYRISALDWLGNESQADNLLSIPAVNTFTYAKDLPPKPVMQPPTSPVTAGCSRIIRWRPLYDPATYQGFIVFRSQEREGVYRQISPIIKGNEFQDTSALQGKKYWYRVQAVDLRGKLSEPSDPVQY